MLSITSSAAEIVNTARAQQGVPEHFGLRVFPEQTAEGVRVQLAFSEGPVEGDLVSEAADTPLYVAPELAEPLAGTVIDAEDGPGGGGLVFRDAEPA
jgi:Fe-S cluster assembly iron-binding protein IscA